MESSFRPAVISEAGAVGLMQLRPFVAQDVAERHDLLWSGEITLVEPYQNVRLGVRYYRELVDRFQGDERLALIAYNRGPTRLRIQMRNNGPDVASSYAENVLRLYKQLCEDCGLLQA
jgi:soluble lytic murein transglycosylase